MPPEIKIWKPSQVAKQSEIRLGPVGHERLCLGEGETVRSDPTGLVSWNEGSQQLLSNMAQGLDSRGQEAGKSRKTDYGWL